MLEGIPSTARCASQRRSTRLLLLLGELSGEVIEVCLSGDLGDPAVVQQPGPEIGRSPFAEITGLEATTAPGAARDRHGAIVLADAGEAQRLGELDHFGDQQGVRVGVTLAVAGPGGFALPSASVVGKVLEGHELTPGGFTDPPHQQERIGGGGVRIEGKGCVDDGENLALPILGALGCGGDDRLEDRGGVLALDEVSLDLFSVRAPLCDLISGVLDGLGDAIGPPPVDPADGAFAELSQRLGGSGTALRAKDGGQDTTDARGSYSDDNVPCLCL